MTEDPVSTVISRHRRTVTVEHASGQLEQSLLQGRRLQPVVGDRVRWSRTADDTLVVNGILPRRTELARTNRRGQREPIAANLTDLLVVVAPKPDPDPFLIDRYLGSAILAEIGASIVFNKSDIGPPPPTLLAPYIELGYQWLVTSTKTGEGIPALQAYVEGRVAVLVGQSGVGKSSILNALLAQNEQAIGGLSSKSGHGKHTTTASRLFRLANGGQLIDSPGVRDFSPHLTNSDEILRAFPEIASAAAGCRFNDCAHHNEPDCAVKREADAGAISPRRLESFYRLQRVANEVML